MALTAYCKKCQQEVDAAEVCPYCGTKLGRNAAHAAWCLERTPVRDWMCWNAVMRLLLPAALVVLILALILEGLSGGIGAVEKLLSSGFLGVLLILLATIMGIVLVILALQGRELVDYVVDNRGAHITRYLPHPTPLKLLARGKSPALMRQTEGTPEVLKVGETGIAWRDVARVQLWPEKCMILLYAPAWWLRAPLVCTPFTWEDAMSLIREKLGKKRKIQLPASLVIPPTPSARKTKPKAPLAPEVEDAIEQLRMEEIARTDLPAESEEKY